MAYLDAALCAFDRAIATRRIGIPRAVHGVIHVTQDPGQIETHLGRILSAIGSWFGSAPRRIAAAGSADSGQIAVLATFEGGQSALLSVGVCGLGGAQCELVVFGTQGVCSWEAGGSTLPLWAPAHVGQLTTGERGWVERCEQALAANGSIPSDPTVRETGSAVVDGALGRLISLVRQPATNHYVPKVPPYGVLLISGDHTHQPGYAEAFAADSRCRLVGLTDAPELSHRRRELNARLACRLEIPLFPDLEAALARPDVDIVSVCAEPERRGPLIVQAALAGKHLYLDKPLAGSAQAAEQIVNAVQGAGVISHMFSQVHASPATEIRHLIRSGRLGDLLGIHCALCFAKGYAGTARLGVRRREVETPGYFEAVDAKRELNNIGIYPIILLLWAIQRPVRKVFAVTSNHFFAEHQARDMEDFGQMLVEFEGGLVATITAGRTGWNSHPSSGLNRVAVIGARECAVIDAHRPRVEVWSDAPPWTPPPRFADDPMAMWALSEDSPFQARPKESWVTPHGFSWSTDVDHFLSCVERGRASEVPASLAAAAMGVLFAAYRSAACEAWVDFS